jgi:phosphoribosyl-ATP pyrophosphohydrolase
MKTDNKFLTKLEGIAQADVKKLIEAEKSYGDSWKRRGGVGAFMMLARKWDRIEKQVGEKGYDIFTACVTDQRKEGVIDDIRDLRQYLILVEAELQVRGHHGGEVETEKQ